MMMHPPTLERTIMLGKIPSKDVRVYDEKDLLKCNYRGKTRHSRELCWRLYGWPNKGRGKGRGGSSAGRQQANFSKNAIAGASLSMEEIQLFKSMMTSLNSQQSP